MIELLREKFQEERIGLLGYGGANKFVPCLAHIIHNCVLAFLKVMQSMPRNKIDPWDKSVELGNWHVQLEDVNSDDDEVLTQHTSKRRRVDGRTGRHKSYASLEELRGFEKTTAKLCKIAKAASNSAQRKETFEAIVEKHLNKKLGLKLDVCTRWHSTAVMIERALILRKPIAEFLQSRPELEPLILKDGEWAQLEIILGALRPFYSCAMELMTSSGITIHLTFQVYDYLYDHIEKMQSDMAPRIGVPGRQVAHAAQIREGLEAAKKLLGKYYYMTDKNPTYYAAHYFDPTLKGSLFKRDSWNDQSSYVDDNLRILRDRYSNEYCDRNGLTGSQSISVSHFEQNSQSQCSQESDYYPAAQRSKKRVSLFNSKIGNVASQPIQSTPYDVFDKFVKRSPIPRSDDHTAQVLDYWQSQEALQPALTLMARDTLAVPATGIDVEQLFSQGRNAVNHHCYRLDKQTISDIMFLRSASMRKQRNCNLRISAEFESWKDVMCLQQELDTYCRSEKLSTNVQHILDMEASAEEVRESILEARNRMEQLEGV